MAIKHATIIIPAETGIATMPGHGSQADLGFRQDDRIVGLLGCRSNNTAASTRLTVVGAVCYASVRIEKRSRQPRESGVRRRLEVTGGRLRWACMIQDGNKRITTVAHRKLNP